jgi:1-acyl-sn-glycerol-3-phosphate acyltransferase
MIPARRSEPFMRFFECYVSRYIRRRFHRVYLWGGPRAVAVPAGVPALFVMSHSAWWDVLVGYYLSRRLIRRESYAPMDEAQLRRYPVLARIGVYSLDRFSVGGVRAFLRYTTALLRGERAVWITPQGEIASGWRRPVRFQPGVGHLVRRVGRLAVIPVAMAYEFGEEPRADIFIKFGPPRLFGQPRADAEAITRILEGDLEAGLDALQGSVRAGDRTPFTVLLEGATSVSLVYDGLRRLRAWVTGRPDPRRHGDLVSDPRRAGVR